MEILSGGCLHIDFELCNINSNIIYKYTVDTHVLYSAVCKIFVLIFF